MPSLRIDNGGAGVDGARACRNRGRIGMIGGLLVVLYVPFLWFGTPIRRID